MALHVVRDLLELFHGCVSELAQEIRDTAEELHVGCNAILHQKSASTPSVPLPNCVWRMRCEVRPSNSKGVAIPLYSHPPCLLFCKVNRQQLVGIWHKDGNTN